MMLHTRNTILLLYYYDTTITTTVTTAVIETVLYAVCPLRMYVCNDVIYFVILFICYCTTLIYFIGGICAITMYCYIYYA